jgi:iron-sulfur cluster insertion protein
MITITETAANKVLEIIAGDPELKGAGFRLGVQGAGCAGFQYVFGIEADIAEDDTILESNGVKVIVDPMSYQYLMGVTIDYTKDLMGEAFTIKNPGATTTCGCGHSFGM